jgi:hypothetical protein
MCGWTSGKRGWRGTPPTHALGKLHEQDNPGHTVVLKEVSDGERTPRKAVGKKP